jgi:hypothetical protein
VFLKRFAITRSFSPILFGHDSTSMYIICGGDHWVGKHI